MEDASLDEQMQNIQRPLMLCWAKQWCIEVVRSLQNFLHFWGFHFQLSLPREAVHFLCSACRCGGFKSKIMKQRKGEVGEVSLDRRGKKHHRVLKLKIPLNVFFQCWICPELTLARRAMEHWATPPVRHQTYLQTNVSVSLSYFFFFKLHKNFPIEIKPPFYTKNLRIVRILDENKLVALFILKTRVEREKTHNEILVGQFVGEEKHTSFIPERLRLSKESQPVRSEWCVVSYSGH